MSAALERFARLSLADKRRVVQNARAGLIDEPADFAEMEELLAEGEYEGPPLPGGVSRAEQLAHEARVRAGLVDRPGDVERLHARLRAERAERKRRESLRGYRPPYPWSQI